MIIVGYPGVGKSTAAKNDFRFIDLDSCFWEKKDPSWANSYCALATDLSKQGYYVLVSSHAEVRNRLIGSKERVVLCYPAPELKEAWIEKLRSRYESDRNSKTHNAWKRAADHFDDDIAYMSEFMPFRKIVISTMKYNLKKMIVQYKDLVD